MTLDLFKDTVTSRDKSAIFYHFHTFTQGTFLLAATIDGLCAIGFPTIKPDIFFKNLKFRFPNGQLVKTEEPFDDAIFQLESYFSGQIENFDLPLELIGTKFQIRVWEYLLKIPYGETFSYKQVAWALESNPRTIGRAIGDNPVPIIVPCHRVIGSNGQMIGYSGGVSMKIWLLQHENALII